MFDISIFTNPEGVAVLVVGISLGGLIVSLIVYVLFVFRRRKSESQQKKIQENLRRLVHQDREETEAAVATIKNLNPAKYREIEVKDSE